MEFASEDDNCPRSFSMKSLWNSGQWYSAYDKVKNIVGGPSWAIVAFKSSVDLCQYAGLPVIFFHNA